MEYFKNVDINKVINSYSSIKNVSTNNKSNIQEDNLFDDYSESNDQDSLIETNTGLYIKNNKPNINNNNFYALNVQSISPQSSNSLNSSNLNNNLQQLFDLLSINMYGITNNTIDCEDLFFNINKMLSSENVEISGIAGLIEDVYESVGVSLWDDNLGGKPLYSSDDFAGIVMTTIMQGIQGKELDPDYGNKLIDATGQKTGLSIDDLIALDKNNNGSIVDELKEILTGKEFTETLDFKIQRKKNEIYTNNLISNLDTNNDGKITEIELKNMFGQNEIADLFMSTDGDLDKELMIALGTGLSIDSNGLYSIKGIERIDYNRDGLITKDEVDKFKSSELYQKLLDIKKEKAGI